MADDTFDIYEWLSGLRPYSLAIITQDKPEGTDMVSVSLIERTTTTNGLLKEASTTFDVEGVDHQGVPAQARVTAGATITARWLPYSVGNRMTSPNVREGETVMVYRYRDTADYYWDTIFREPSIRRLERVIHAYGNLSSGNQPFDVDSSYYMEFDTINKVINIATSKSDGEAFSYQITIDPGKSTLIARDNIGNRFGIDSERNHVFMQDVSGGRFDTNDGHPIISGNRLRIDAALTTMTGNCRVHGWFTANYPHDDDPGHDDNHEHDEPWHQD